MSNGILTRSKTKVVPFSSRLKVLVRERFFKVEIEIVRFNTIESIV